MGKVEKEQESKEKKRVQKFVLFGCSLRSSSLRHCDIQVKD